MMTAASQDVSDVLVGGRVLLRDGQFTGLDEEKILSEGRNQMRFLLERTTSHR